VRAKCLAALLLVSSSPALALTAHDGHWRVDLETTVGNCPRSGQVVVTVKDERLAAIDADGVATWGYIDGTNTFVGRFTLGEKIVRANGDVKGSTASGPWSSNTDYCGGRWTARKID
jgi:hypothetical protein